MNILTFPISIFIDCSSALLFSKILTLETLITWKVWAFLSFFLWLYNWLGRVYFRLRKLEKAIKYFEKANNINLNAEDTCYYLGVYYYEIEDYDKAIIHYKKSLDIDDKQSETHLNLGMCYSRLDMKEKDIKEFEIAYKYDSDCSDAIYNKGIVLISMNKYQEALDNLLDLNKLRVNDVEVMMDIAHCYYKTKDLDTSSVWVNKALDVEPQHDLANKLLKRLAYLKNNSTT